MTDELDPGQITRLLTQGTRHLNAVTISALGIARQNALKKQATSESAIAFVSVSGRSQTRWADRLISRPTQPWVAAVILVAVIVAGASYWQSFQEQQIDEADVAILTGDLPIEVFVN